MPCSTQLGDERYKTTEKLNLRNFYSVHQNWFRTLLSGSLRPSPVSLRYLDRLLSKVGGRDTSCPRVARNHRENRLEVDPRHWAVAFWTCPNFRWGQAGPDRSFRWKTCENLYLFFTLGIRSLSEILCFIGAYFHSSQTPLKWTLNEQLFSESPSFLDDKCNLLACY